LRHLVPGGVPGGEGAQCRGRLVRYPKPWQGLRAPVHRAGRADGLGPQSAICSPGFRDAPRFAPAARVFPGAAPCRSESLMALAPHAPRLGPQVGVGGDASTILNPSDMSNNPRQLEPTTSGIREAHSAVVTPSRHPSGRFPRPCGQTVTRPRFRGPQPGSDFAAAELEPTPCNFSSALKVVTVKCS
jgi:hypothetical protein